MKSKIFLCAAFVSMMVSGQVVSNVSLFSNEVFANSSRTNSLNQNRIQLRGAKVNLGGTMRDDHGFDLVFDTSDMKIKFDRKLLFSNLGIDDKFNRERYIKFDLYDKDFNRKSGFELQGQEFPLSKIGNYSASFNYGDYVTVYHADLNNWNYQVTGTVLDANNQYKEKIYKITANGLQQIKPFENTVEIRGIDAGDGHGFAYKNHGFDVKFYSDKKINNNKIKIDLRDTYEKTGIHPYFENTYVKFDLLDENWKRKSGFELKGTQSPTTIKDYTGDFKYGDYLMISHEEPNSRLRITGNVKDQKKVKQNIYKITEDGLQQIKPYENTIKLRGRTLIVNGQHFKDHGFDLKFNTDRKMMVVDMTTSHPYEIHSGFKNTYIKVELKGKNNVTKNSFELKGTELPSKVKDFTASFEYGDVLEIFHAEGQDWRYSVTGNVKDQKNKRTTYKYEITETGLKQIN